MGTDVDGADDDDEEEKEEDTPLFVMDGVAYCSIYCLTFCLNFSGSRSINAAASPFKGSAALPYVNYGSRDNGLAYISY